MSVSVPNIASLKQIRVDQANGVIRWVDSKVAWYYPDINSTDTPDDDNVVLPDQGLGRWIKQKSSARIIDFNKVIVATSSNINPLEPNTRYIIDSHAVSGSSIIVTLPTNPSIHFSETEIIIQGTNGAKLIEIVASGTALINNRQENVKESLLNGTRYRINYVNSTIGWIITKAENTLAVFTVPRSSPIVFTRDWDGVGNYTFSMGLTDIIGRDFNLSNIWVSPKHRQWGEVANIVNINYLIHNSRITLADNTLLKNGAYPFSDLDFNPFDIVYSTENTHTIANAAASGFLFNYGNYFSRLFFRGKSRAGFQNVNIRLRAILFIFQIYEPITGGVSNVSHFPNGINYFSSIVIRGSKDIEIVTTINNNSRRVNDYGLDLTNLYDFCVAPNSEIYLRNMYSPILSDFNPDFQIINQSRLPAPYNNDRAFGLYMTVNQSEEFINNIEILFPRSYVPITIDNSILNIAKIDFFGDVYGTN